LIGRCATGTRGARATKSPPVPALEGRRWAASARARSASRDGGEVRPPSPGPLPTASANRPLHGDHEGEIGEGEEAVDHQASFIDGVRIDTPEGWVLVLPDQYRPVAHIYAESTDPTVADQLRDTYRAKVLEWLDELSATIES
jgi:2-hydroxychromene-2-carboxylate isomerase